MQSMPVVSAAIPEANLEKRRDWNDKPCSKASKLGSTDAVVNQIRNGRINADIPTLQNLKVTNTYSHT